ncbi:MAG: recombinase family protein, partial [Prevotella sp.]|nr:recombinase family protein [Prevotella sp.]
MYNNLSQNPKRTVVLYARVSTEHEAQLSALDNQVDWYKAILTQHPEWTLIREYVDEGITGTAAYKRPQFMQMLQDADTGEFDLILTREVSRFARNTVDALQYTRQLKAKGVEVFFINDNIRTFDGDGELRLTIMATLAQDESRKTSIRVKSGQQTSMEKGVLYGNGNILGYDRVGKELVINPEQAKTVRMIYDWYLDGWGLRKIQYELEKQGRLTAMGQKHWYCTVISKTLRNPFYCGTIVYHKQYTPDFLEQKKINNFGDVEYTTIKGTHETIVTEEEFEQVQAIMESRRRTVSNNDHGKRRTQGDKPKLDVWCRLLKCSCGHDFNRKVWHDYGTYKQYGYQCYSSIRTGTVKTRLNKGLSIEGICDSPMIPGWKLQMMAQHIFRNYLSDTEQVLETANSLLEQHRNDKENTIDNSEIIQQKKDELDKMVKRLDNLVEMRADGEITRDIFQKKKQDVENRISTLQSEIEALTPSEELEEDTDYENKITVLRYALERYVDFSSNEDIPDSV